MLSKEQVDQFSDILEEMGKTLDITESQHAAAVERYEFVGDWLAREDSPLAKYNPEILPQGSFMLGTMIRPENEEDDLDIDLVCRLEGKRAEWTQFNLKAAVGDRLKGNGIIEKLLVRPDGRRCWTLKYSEQSRFHMDILPSIVSNDYQTILAKSLAATSATNLSELAIRITDKEQPNYTTSTIPEEWLVSNPFGYGIWFEQRATVGFQKAIRMSEAIQPVPVYRAEKLPLQRVVQILKRHRDMMFNGDDNKPVSIIITTLAARAYRQESSIIEALVNVSRQMALEIEERFDPKSKRNIKWIGNPVNPEENFADKWVDEPEKEAKFYRWMQQLGRDLDLTLQQRGVHAIQESMGRPYGKRIVAKAFSNYGDKVRRLRESGALKVTKGTATLGTAGSTVKTHTFHGR